MKLTMDEHTTSRIYDRFSVVYDKTFGRLVQRRQRIAIEQLGLEAGDRVLDLGVGTGLTIPMYPEDVTIVGLDLSWGMLEEARRRALEAGRKAWVVQADALRPPLRPESFDHVLITHVISVVSDPAELLRRSAELTRRGGRIVLLNHFRAEHGPVASLEKAINPLCMKVGWRSDLSLAESLENVPLKVEKQIQLRRWDLWKIIVLRHVDEA